MRPKSVYLLLAVLGAVVPYMHFLPWLLQHGPDLPLFTNELLANRISEFFAADVFISAVVVIALMLFERRRLGNLWWLPVLALLIFGVSAALPLVLYLGDRARTE